MTPEAELEKLYNLIPPMECKGLCGKQFCGAIGMGETERLRILDRIGHPPSSRVFPAIMVDGTQELRFLNSLEEQGNCLRCPMLQENGTCRVYNIRPMICRLWGACEGLRCPHGCRPKTLLTHQQFTDLMQRSIKL